MHWKCHGWNPTGLELNIGPTLLCRSPLVSGRCFHAGCHHADRSLRDLKFFWLDTWFFWSIHQGFGKANPLLVVRSPRRIDGPIIAWWWRSFSKYHSSRNWKLYHVWTQQCYAIIPFLQKESDGKRSWILLLLPHDRDTRPYKTMMVCNRAESLNIWWTLSGWCRYLG